MSHPMAYAFDRFVFFQASAADRERIHALQILNPRLSRQRVVFSDTSAEITAQYAPGDGSRGGKISDILPHNAGDLFICCGDSMPVVWRHTIDAGGIAGLTLAAFERQAVHLMNLQAAAVFGEVVLAFLPDPLKLQAMRMFSLFGFNPVAVDSTQALLKELKHGASMVVFDQDMPTMKNRVHESREKIFSLLRSERRQHRHLAVMIIKDFEQGSLFGDMTTMAKDVSNAMLSPDEFLEFIRNYLCDFHTAHATWKLKVGNATGLAQATYTGRPAAYLGLADVKSAFQLFQDKAYHEFMHAREQMFVETHDLAVRMAVTEWLFDPQVAEAAEIATKNLLVKTELPRLFEKPGPQIHMPEQGADEPQFDETMFN